MPLLSGPELDEYTQQKLNPFVVKDGKAIGLKPAEERISIVSSNANNPLWQEQIKGIALAHADKENPTVGGGALSFNSALKGGARSTTLGVIKGAKMSYDQLAEWVEAYNLKGFALFIDHFTGPDRENALKSGYDPKAHISKYEARKRIIGALDFLIESDLNYAEIWGKKEGNKVVWDSHDYDFRRASLEQVKKEETTLEQSVNLYLSRGFQEFRRQCLGVAGVIPGAASFMVELGAYRPWENIALSKDIFDGIKEILPNILTEVSIVDTGEKREYNYLSDPEPPNIGEAEDFAKVAISVVRFTEANKVSYPGGATHALDLSKKKRGIDLQKVEITQRELYNAFGKVVPIAWHGGTSLYPWSEIEVIRQLRDKIRHSMVINLVASQKDAADLMQILQNPEIQPGTQPEEWRGLVTQININTTYLAIAMAAAMDYGLNNIRDVVAMGKKAGGFANQIIEWVRQCAVENSKIAGSYGKSPFGGGIDISKLKEYHIVGDVGKGSD